MSHQAAEPAGDHEHPPHLQHHFENLSQQFDAGKLGIWLFLATEILLFGGLFCAYAIYRANHPEIFLYAHQFLDKTLGATNTVILLCSSLTMAWAVRASQLGQRRLLVVLLGLTLAGGFGFMGIKFVEYKEKFAHGLLPGTHFHPHEEGESAPAASATPLSTPAASPAPGAAPGASPTPLAAPAAPARAGALTIEPSRIRAAASGPAGTVRSSASEDLEHGAFGKRPSNAQIFFGIYFLMTGLHGIHVLVGMIAIAWILVRSLRGEFGPGYFTPVDFVGLYWHLVDLIWIFLFPLLYLVK